MVFIQPEILLQGHWHSARMFRRRRFIRRGGASPQCRPGEPYAAIEVGAPIQQMCTEVERNQACAGVLDQCAQHTAANALPLVVGREYQLAQVNIARAVLNTRVAAWLAAEQDDLAG